MINIKIEVTRENALSLLPGIISEDECYAVWSALYDAHKKFFGTERWSAITDDIENLMTDMAYEILKAEEISPIIPHSEAGKFLKALSKFHKDSGKSKLELKRKK